MAEDSSTSSAASSSDKASSASKDSSAESSDSSARLLMNQLKMANTILMANYYVNDKKVTGWKYISYQHKTVYYNSKGQMLYGKQRINGSTYTFDRITSALE